VEFKLNPAPKMGRGFRLLVDELSPTMSWYVTPAKSAYSLTENVRVGSVLHAIDAINGL
jgi:hypothetical protein